MSAVMGGHPIHNRVLFYLPSSFCFYTQVKDGLAALLPSGWSRLSCFLCWCYHLQKYFTTSAFKKLSANV